MASYLAHAIKTLERKLVEISDAYDMVCIT